MDRLIRFLRRVLYYCAFFAAAVMTLLGISNFQSLHQKTKWPTVEATIVEASSSPSPSNSDKSVLRFRYSYQLKGRTITSSKIFASTFREKVEYSNEVADVVARFRKGTKARAYCNPESAYESYLDISPALIDYVLPCLGAAGLTIFIAHRYAERKKRLA